jgi:hypothetical protein
MAYRYHDVSGNISTEREKQASARRKLGLGKEAETEIVIITGVTYVIEGSSRGDFLTIKS